MMSMVADDMNLKVRETPKKALSALFEDQPCIVNRPCIGLCI